MSLETFSVEALCDTLTKIPPADLADIIMQSVGVKIDTYGSDPEMPWSKCEYSLHPLDHIQHVKFFDSMFGGLPHETVVALIARAQQMTRENESKKRERFMQARNSHYLAEDQILINCRAHLAEGNPKDAYDRCLSKTQDGHSGFTAHVERVYFAPDNAKERIISNGLYLLHVETASALLNRLVPETALNDFAHVSAVYTCLERLGGGYLTQHELVFGLEMLLTDYLDVKPDFTPAQDLLKNVQERFLQ